MSAPIKKVALAGATGNLGPSILAALVAANFSVTVLTRHDSTNTSTASLPAGVTVTKVDYTSLPSLTAALKDHDAVVSTLTSHSPTDPQLLLITAAAQAGVRRFVPSEFGSDTLNPKVRALPMWKNKQAVQQRLEEEAQKPGGLEYTLILTGLFFDWALKVGFLANLKERSVRLYDGGERSTSVVLLSDVGKAVAGVLAHPEQTRNRVVRVHSAVLSGKKLLELGQKATGTTEAEWKVEHANVEQVLQDGLAEFGKESPHFMKAAMAQINASLWGEGYGMPMEKTDNELLGVPVLGEEEILALFKQFA